MAVKRYYLLLWTLLLLFSFVKASDFSVKATIDSATIKIGEQTKIHFEVTQPKNKKVQLPIFSDSLMSGIDLVQRLRPDTINLNNGQIKVNHSFIITSFDSALYTIPSYEFTSGTDTVKSNTLSLKVNALRVDTTKNKFYDIKPIYNAKFDWVTFLKRVLIGLFIIGLLILAYIFIRKYIKKKKSGEIFENPEFLLPPHIWAQAELDRIKSEKIWQQGRMKEFHTQLTDVLRKYVERRFEINALEMTSDELLNAMVGHTDLQKSSYELLKQVLQLADLVKFAKYTPFISDNEMSLMNAYLFVNQTKEEEIKPVEETRAEMKELNQTK